MRYYFLLLVAIVALSSCNQQAPAPSHEAMKARLDSLRNDLLQTDLSFSQLSEQKGRNAAFIAFAAEHATMLRPYSMPLTGKDSIISRFSSYPDSGFILTWVPIKADVARSGELDFTYGTYQVVIKGIKGIDKEEGTYCTIWKKDKNHSWKFVLDSGNEGLNSGEESADKEIKAEVKMEQKKEAKKK
jgi:ketosteroid isomerase-like protein